MILAAGLGKRMLPLTAQTPKGLLDVAGKPLIVWHIERLVRHGCRRIVINRNEQLGAKLEQAVGTGENWGVEVLWSREEQLLETGGGLLQALPLIGDDPFLVVNADVFTTFDFSRLALTRNCQACLVLVPNPGHNPEGDFCLQGASVSTQASPRLTFAGVSLLDPSLFAGLKPGPFPLAVLLRKAAACGRVTGIFHEGYWIDVGTPERLQQVTCDLREGRGGVPESARQQSLSSHHPA
ncbi:MAG: nucleotidyltransferase family protein [Kistimonas sp.]|nr:nucleotidyltransferase family protein [Kistimonas sp.]